MRIIGVFLYLFLKRYYCINAENRKSQMELFNRVFLTICHGQTITDTTVGIKRWWYYPSLNQWISYLSIKSAAIIRADSVDHFLDKMHHSTTICSNSLKENLIFNFRFNKTKDIHKYNKLSTNRKNSDDSNGKSSPQKQDLFCVYCHNKGHLREDCLKLKKKEQHKKSTSSRTLPIVAAVEKQSEDTTLVVAVNNDNNKKIITDSMILKVIKINNISCNLVALLDTGSPNFLYLPSKFQRIFCSFVNCS